ncbi:MAG: prepilin peptidase [Armatimonadota bacterium]|nr:prepilin peptidase [Armatimonadota bacterium]MDW8104050.1 prepilin peptidase [Armatimonadota bacterium]
MPEWYIGLVVFIYGTVVGSFLNVLIYRLPRGLSIIKPRSHCPNCATELRARDLVPLLSFLWQRGRCRYCGARISWRYFWVELATGLLFLGVYWRYGWSWDTLFYLLFAAALVAAFFIDLEHFLIPDGVNVFMFALGILRNVVLIAQGDPQAWVVVAGWKLPYALVGSVVCTAIFATIAVMGRVMFRKDAMGFGDVKLARAIGSLLPLNLALLAFAGAVALGAVVGGALVLLSAQKQQTPAARSAAEDIAPATSPEPLTQTVLYSLALLVALDVLLFLYDGIRSLISPAARRGVPMEEDEFVPGLTTIPFGPYIVAATLLALIGKPYVLSLWNAYWRWATGGG